MQKAYLPLLSAASTLFSLSLFGGCCQTTCCQSIDVEVGWRRDQIDWKVNDLHSHYVKANVDDKIDFKDINSTTISANAKWISTDFYIRCSADYGWVDKGRAHENFHISSPYLYDYSERVHTSNRIKRWSEVYDFDAAVGYPFSFCCCRLSIIPLIGFSYHRQHLRVKQQVDYSSHVSSSNPYYYDSYYYPDLSYSNFFDYYSSSDFYIDSYNAFYSDRFINPFDASSDSTIAYALGMRNPHKTSTYRLTWYGFYLGADMAYALDECWTLYWDTEFHFLDNCHRKRKSWTGVSILDEYHHKGEAYGFNNVIGATCYLANNWYTVLSVDYDWWKASSKHDTIHWQKVEAKIGLAYAF